MLKIAHRGNFQGQNRELENSFSYLEAALDSEYHIEVDIRYLDNNWWLGHDEPDYKVTEQQLDRLPWTRTWYHAKNFGALELLAQRGLNVFAHDNDKFALTSRGFYWTALREYENKNMVVMVSNPTPKILQELKTRNVYGICCDDFTGME